MPFVFGPSAPRKASSRPFNPPEMPPNVAVWVPPPHGDALHFPGLLLRPQSAGSAWSTPAGPTLAGLAVQGMMAEMTLRMCLLALSAGFLLNQAALGCRHHRPTLAEASPHASCAQKPGTPWRAAGPGPLAPQPAVRTAPLCTNDTI